MSTRLGKIVRAANWKYAAGELILIVAGILIALGLDSWHDLRVEHREEVAALREVQSKLAEDLRTLTAQLDTLRGREERIASLERHLANGGTYADTLDSYFGAVIRFHVTVLNRSAYEGLKSRGLSLISNEVLRAGLTELYDQKYLEFDNSAQDDRDVTLEVVRPYFLREFKDVRFGVTATPRDAVVVMKDPIFLNIVAYRLQSLRVNAIQTHEAISKDVDALLQALNHELNERDAPADLRVASPR